MVLGVLAATITVTQSPTSGQIGTYVNNTGNMAITDKGLAVVANSTVITANTTALVGGAGSNKNLFNGSPFVAGHWMETITFSDTVDSLAHTVTIKINNGNTAPNTSTALGGGTITLTITAASSSGTITDYIDLGVAAITGPMTVYISAT
jgi:hypothetical protein